MDYLRLEYAQITGPSTINNIQCSIQCTGKLISLGEVAGIDKIKIMNATITLREYLEKEKTFVIPNYQRGYVWGKNSKGKDLDAVSYILEKSLIPGFNNQTPVFIQGITVTEKNNEIILIDGQQRTTFFYLLLRYLEYKGNKGNVEMKYTIRKESNDFLSKLDVVQTDVSENIDEDFQDIFFFKKTLRIIKDKLDKEKKYKEEFLNYILDYVKFLYIDIPEEKATKVFSMMNGSKAVMKNEELIKAELLRLASLNGSDFDKKEEKEKNAIEWDNNMLRSRYAREWDKWLQWWNRDDVKKLFGHSNVMGHLVSTYSQMNDVKELSFDNFKNKYLLEQKPVVAKKTFDGLRRLQKRFEDAFNNSKIYNWVGAILRIGEKDSFIKWYFASESKPSNEDLENYYKMSFLRLTHKEIVPEKKEEFNRDKYDEKFEALYKILDSNELYNDNAEEAFRLLLRLNIDEDNKQESNKGRKFDFNIWDGNRSLEHIYPKSKVWHKELDADGVTEIIKTGDGGKRDSSYIDKTCIERTSCTYKVSDETTIEASEHSIGNLVLLYGKNNSSFGNKGFEDKKHTFFEPSEKNVFESRHLLHTIYKFAQSKWNGEQIAKNKYQILQEFKEYYGK